MKNMVWALIFLAPVWADWQERYRVGERLLKEGAIVEAHQELAAALLEVESAGQDGPRRGAILDALGRTEFRAGKYRSAVKCFERSLRLWPERSEAQAAALSNAGQAYQALGEYARAQESFRKALDILPQSPLLWHALGQALFLKRRYGEAESAQRKALAIWEDSDPAAASVVLNDLAVLYEFQHRRWQAKEMLERAVARASPGQQRARILTNLGALTFSLGHKTLAIRHFSQALTEMESAVGTSHPDVGRILEEYSAVLRKAGFRSAANEMVKQAQSIRASFAVQTNSQRATVTLQDLK